jgi:hypothetical protein
MLYRWQILKSDKPAAQTIRQDRVAVGCGVWHLSDLGASTEGLRAEKVAKIQNAIECGTYSVGADQIASKIIGAI